VILSTNSQKRWHRDALDLQRHGLFRTLDLIPGLLVVWGLARPRFQPFEEPEKSNSTIGVQLYSSKP
jgi:hypothetical protein